MYALFLLAISLLFVICEECKSTLIVPGTIVVNGVLRTVIDVPLNLGQSACFELLGDTDNPVRRVKVSASAARSLIRYSKVGVVVLPSIVRRSCGTGCGDGDTARFLARDNELIAGSKYYYWNWFVGNTGCNKNWFTGAYGNVRYAATMFSVRGHESTEYELYHVTYLSPAIASVDADGCPITIGNTLGLISCDNSTKFTQASMNVDLPAVRGRYALYNPVANKMHYLSESFVLGCRPIGSSPYWLQDDGQGLVGITRCLESSLRPYTLNDICEGGGAMPTYPLASIEQDTALDAGIGLVTSTISDMEGDKFTYAEGLSGVVSLRFVVESSRISMTAADNKCTILRVLSAVPALGSDVGSMAWVNEIPITNCWIRSEEDYSVQFRCTSGLCLGKFPSLLGKRTLLCSINCVDSEIVTNVWNYTFVGSSGVVTGDIIDHGGGGDISFGGGINIGSVFPDIGNPSNPLSAITSVIMSVVAIVCVIAIIKAVMGLLKSRRSKEDS